MEKKVIFLIFDALPYELFKTYGYKYTSNIKKFDIIPLETLIGYSSGIYPSIWTGFYPDQTNYWAGCKFNNKNLKNNEKKKLRIFDKIMFFLSYTPIKLSQIISLIFFQLSFRFNLIKYHFPPLFDLHLSRLFVYDDIHRTLMVPERKKNLDYKTFFSILHENKISFKYIETENYVNDFLKFNESVIFYSNPILDTYGHKFGPNSKIYLKKAKEIFKWINNIISNENFKIFLFSDHGMTKVNKRFYPKPIFKELGLKLNHDLIVWIDSTMIRFWFINKKSLKMKNLLIDRFNKEDKGHFLTKFEKEKYGLNFKNRFFGDLLFLVDPHYEIFPNFFNINPFNMISGMHGYHPDHESSYGIFYSNFLDIKAPLSVINLFKIFIEALHLT